MLAIIGRLRMRNVHQKLFRFVEISLRESKPQRNVRVAMEFGISAPITRQCVSPLMDNISPCTCCWSSNCSGQKTAGGKEGETHGIEQEFHGPWEIRLSTSAYFIQNIRACYLRSRPGQDLHLRRRHLSILFC